MHTWTAAVLTAAAVATSTVSAGAATTAPTDTTPPAITVSQPRYLVGSYLHTDYFNYNTHAACTPRPLALNCELTAEWQGMWFGWRTSDPSGVCSQKITEQSYDTLDGDPDPVLGSETDTVRVRPDLRRHSYNASLNDIARVPTRFVVRPTDCAGNTATSAIVTTFGTGVDEDSGYIAPVTYFSYWKIAHARTASGGTTHATVTAGASAGFTVSGHIVGLVMGKAPDRGSADVYLDGIRQATVDTYSPTTLNRQIVWEAKLPAGGAAHTVKIRNRATAGHPRIDLDALIFS